MQRTALRCAAAPALFYADWAHPIGEAFPDARAYRRQRLARPSFARAVDEARPYRSLFPLGAPDRDEEIHAFRLEGGVGRDRRRCSALRGRCAAEVVR